MPQLARRRRCPGVLVSAGQAARACGSQVGHLPGRTVGKPRKETSGPCGPVEVSAGPPPATARPPPPACRPPPLPPLRQVFSSQGLACLEMRAHSTFAVCTALVAALALARVRCAAASSGPSYILPAAAQAGSAQPYARGCQVSAAHPATEMLPPTRAAAALRRQLAGRRVRPAPARVAWARATQRTQPSCPPSSAPPRPALQNRQVSLAVGSGAGAVQYQFSVDTGSSLLEVTCQSAAAQANCGGRALAGSYVLTPAHAITSPAACADTGVDCYVPGAAGAPGTCYFSQGVSGGGGGGARASLVARTCGAAGRGRAGWQAGAGRGEVTHLAPLHPTSAGLAHSSLLQLTGGSGYNGRHGVFASDQVAAATVGGSAAVSLTLPNATIACAQSTWSCGELDSACIKSQDACPPAATPGLLQGGCPTAGMGFELGERARAGAWPLGCPAAAPLLLPLKRWLGAVHQGSAEPPRCAPLCRRVARFTFAQPGGSPASAVSLPEQVYQAGLIQERVVRHSGLPPAACNLLIPKQAARAASALLALTGHCSACPGCQPRSPRCLSLCPARSWASAGSRRRRTATAARRWRTTLRSCWGPPCRRLCPMRRPCRRRRCAAGRRSWGALGIRLQRLCPAGAARVPLNTSLHNFNVHGARKGLALNN